MRRGSEALPSELSGARPAAAARCKRGPAQPLAFSLALLEHAAEYRDVSRTIVGHRDGAIELDEIRRALAGEVREDLAALGRDASMPSELAERFGSTHSSP